MKRFSKRGRELKKRPNEVASRRAQGGWPKKYKPNPKEAPSREEEATERKA